MACAALGAVSGLVVLLGLRSGDGSSLASAALFPMLAFAFAGVYLIRFVAASGRETALARAGVPGSWEVLGVDRASGMDTRIRVEAETAANARAKGELKGMIVTEVRQA